MNDPIRVLHLEDNIPDAHLVRSSLEEAGLICEFKRVDTESAFVSALRDELFDLVISDFSLPNYSGRSALKYVHDNYPDIPFIFVSGTVGEDYAIESLLNGCTDYVLKTKMSRLIPAVTRALKEREEKLKRHTAEDRVRERDKRFRALMENSNDGMVVFDIDGRVTMTSPANDRILGRNDYQPEGRLIYEIMSPDDIQSVRAEVARISKMPGTQGRIVFRARHGDGSWRWFEATFSNMLSDPAVRGIVANFRDVTERLESEALLRQAQKMESLGTLAGGIAHDFNNILGIILGYSSFITKHNHDEQKLAQSVSAIESAAKRGVGLVRQLLMFARKQDLELVPVDVNEVVAEVFKLISETFPKLIVPELNQDRHIPLVLGDHVQISQCVLNLCVNARDAMMDRNDGKPTGGKLRVSTGIASEEMLRKHGIVGSNTPYVTASVSDTGIGMDDATLSRIFEPFFTTKDTGKGTGIGLATVFGVMKKHNGFSDVSTKPGEGSTFTLLFPAVEEAERKAASDSPDTSTVNRGNETVLVVEDEEMLRELLRDVLSDSGYEVLTAASGTEALASIAANPNVALVVSDIGLPGLDGMEVTKRIKQDTPDVKVILASGFVDPAEKHRLEESRADGFVSKPYRVSEVLKIIRKALDGNKTNS